MRIIDLFLDNSLNDFSRKEISEALTINNAQ